MLSWDVLLLFGLTLYTLGKAQDEYYSIANVSKYCQQQRNPACCKRYSTLNNCSKYNDQSEWTVQTFCDVSPEAWSVCCEMYPHIESCIKYQKYNCSRNDNGTIICTEDIENKNIQDSNQSSCISNDGKTCLSDANASESNCTCIPMDLCIGNNYIQTYQKFDACEEKNHLCCPYDKIKSSSRNLDSRDQYSSNNPYDYTNLDANAGTHRSYPHNSYSYSDSYNGPSYLETQTIYKPFFIPVPSPPQLVYNVERPFIVPVPVPLVVSPPKPIKVIITPPPPPSSTIPPPTTTSYTPPYYQPYNPPPVPHVPQYYSQGASSSLESYDPSTYLPHTPSYYPSSGTGVPSQYSLPFQPPYPQSLYKSSLPIPSYYPSTYGLPYSFPNTYNYSPSYTTSFNPNPSYKPTYNPSPSYKPSFKFSPDYLTSYAPSQSYNSTSAFTDYYSPAQNLYPDKDTPFMSLEPVYKNSYSTDNKMPQNPYSNENQYENLINSYDNPNYNPLNSIYNLPINSFYTNVPFQHETYLVKKPYTNQLYNKKISSDTSTPQMDYNLNLETYVNNPPDVNSYPFSIQNLNYKPSTTVIPPNKPQYSTLPYEAYNSKVISDKYYPSESPPMDYNIFPQPYNNNPPLDNNYVSTTPNLKYQSSTHMIPLNEPPYQNMESEAYQPEHFYNYKPPNKIPDFNTYQPVSSSQHHDYMFPILYGSQATNSDPPSPAFFYPTSISVPPYSSPNPPTMTPNYNYRISSNINTPSQADTTYSTVQNNFQPQENSRIDNTPLINRDIYSFSTISPPPPMNPEVPTYSRSINQQASTQPSNVSFTNNQPYLHLSNEFAPNGNTLPNIYLPEQSLHNTNLLVPQQIPDVTKYVINPYPAKIHVESDEKLYIKPTNNYPYVKKQFRDNKDIFIEGQTFPILNPEPLILNPNIFLNDDVPPTVPSLVPVLSTSLLENITDSVSSFQQTRENKKDLLSLESNIVTVQEPSVLFNQNEVNRVCGIRNNLTAINNQNQSDISQFARAMNDDPPGVTTTGVEFPWQVSIFLKNMSYICSGALLDSMWILTAAHCVNRYTHGDLLLKFGLQNIKDLNNGPDVSPILIFIHQDFDPISLLNDIALIKFQPGVQLTQNINIICPPSLKDYTGKICTIAGWGKDKKVDQLSEGLQKIDVTVISQSQCQNEMQSGEGLQKSIRLDNRFLCARAVQNTCQGDGGSPLVCSTNGKYELIGVVSWGLDCGNIFPGIYTNVQKYLPWITKSIKF